MTSICSSIYNVQKKKKNHHIKRSFPNGSISKEFACNVGDLQETRVPLLGQEDPLEEEMATHSCILAWKIPCTEESGGGVHGVQT